MAQQEEIVLWIDRRWRVAIEKQLKGEMLQEHLDNELDELCNRLPDQEYTRISNAIQEEARIAREAVEAARTYSAYRVMENGEARYFKVSPGEELLAAAQKLRHYLKDFDHATGKFIGLFKNRDPISPEEFQQMTVQRMENTGKVAGVFDIDFDKREFSAVNAFSRNSGRSPAQRGRPEKEAQRNERALAQSRSEGYGACDDADGWKTWAMHDVSVAAYHAGRKGFMDTEERWQRLVDHLEGKELTSAGHLSAREFTFGDEIIEHDEKLNFYVQAEFDVDTVFGTHVLTDENDDWLNIYANYDTQEDRVCDTLDVTLCKGDGSEEYFSYLLNAAEQEVLLRKMEEYCQKQTGMSLCDYSRQLREEQEQEQGFEPKMKM